MRDRQGTTSWLEVAQRALGRGVFPHQMGWILDLPGRGLILSAKAVAARLPVAPDGRVLEVGPGTGYFSVEVARRIPDGCLTLLDIQPEMLARATQRLQRAGLTNHRAQCCDAGALPFEDGCFDAIFLVTVLGEIEAQDAFLCEAFRVLRPGGVLSVTEHHPDPDFEPAERVAERLAAQGFLPTPKVGWRWAYTLNATKPGAASMG